MNEDITKDKLLNLVSNFIGVEKEELNEDDSFVEDLHLNPSELTELLTTLQENNVETDKLDFAEIETISDMFEALEIE